MTNRDEILERLERLVDAQTYAAIRRDLEAADAAGADASWLAQLLTAAQHLPLPEVPPVLRQELRDMFGERPLPTTHEAVVVFDSRETRDLAGVRGAPTTEGWSLTYTSPVVDVALDVWNEGTSFDVEGHVMAHGEESAAYRAFAVGPTSHRVDGDALGRFRLTGLQTGTYQLQIGNSRFDVSMALDLGEPS